MHVSDTRTTGVLVVGAGAAGLRAALAAHRRGSDVLVLGSRPRGDAHTVLAAGGINAALATVDPDDRWEQHFTDTLAEGYFLADASAVEILAREAPAAIEELAGWGADFARTGDGAFDQRFFGAHTYRRTCYVGDRTGRAVLEALDRQATAVDVPVIDGEYVTHLLVQDGRCRGALAFDLAGGHRNVYLAGAVVLATGGHTRLWQQSTSRDGENTGDGMYLALAAGCHLADMELVQFHPTGMVAPEDAAGTLVTEAVRGEGGRLFNARGERFMERYDPDKLELSTRDRVALACYTEIAEGRGGPNGGVFLDVSQVDRAVLEEKLPNMLQQFRKLQGVDPADEPVEVAPTAHYSMGGVIITDWDRAATEVEGLFAAGETTAGLHGANRLGGNSLAETVVFGRRAGEAASDTHRSGGPGDFPREAVTAAVDDLASLPRGADEHTAALQRSLRELMWRHAGVCRTGPELREGLGALEDLRSMAAGASGADDGPRTLASALVLRGAIVCAEATLRGALRRVESRGSHQRSDHPDVEPDLLVRLTAALRDGRLEEGIRPVPTIPEHLRAWAARAREQEQVVGADRLLE
jgi:succinate dehydrogenase / fumarate reductase, flavoprotein subunit